MHMYLPLIHLLKDLLVYFQAPLVMLFEMVCGVVLGVIALTVKGHGGLFLLQWMICAGTQDSRLTLRNHQSIL